MEINSTNPLIVLKNDVQRLESPQNAERPPKSGGEQPGSDQLDLSALGREISHLNDLIQSTPDVREDKVEKVRQELENGTYNVKAEKIAEKILGGDLLDEII
ncbi:MAG: Anti-sigma-28 factor, FlgM [Acidobacteria bacterium]|jgi:negative regulator of flagellin synthesis FlgM|nr:Anti-sigma-28 factor, FlgM [Acidobacteriota bacterium]